MRQYNYFRKNNKTMKGAIHVGAHRGEEIFLYEKLGAKKVIWIEPDPEVFEELQVALNDSGASLDSYAFCCAASNLDQDGVEFNLYYGPDAGYMVGNKGCSSLLKAKGRFEEWHKDTIKVESVRLDTLLEENEFDFGDFDHLEMDTQGAEMMVVQGADKILEHVKTISTEATWENPDYIGNTVFSELKEYLEERGFEHVETIEHDPNWGDALFVKKS